MNFKALKPIVYSQMLWSILAIIFMIFSFTINNNLYLLVFMTITVLIFACVPIHEEVAVTGVFWVPLVIFISIISMDNNYPDNQVRIQLENQQVEQIHTKEYDPDGTWYKITSDNYPDMYITDNVSINNDGYYGLFSSIKVLPEYTRKGEQ